MNTVKSFWLGWGSLCLGGAGAYVFAKREINRDRQAKEEARRLKKYQNRTLESVLQDDGPAAARDDNAGSPSQEGSSDPAPTRHAPTTEQQQVDEKSKFESRTPFRSPKGDRFS
ncbi:unnamed protein product [Clonostachys rosea]|uniref:HIG1 domain-containing protein n=1 Tax=Bionectria ochroleuca TaxID=29856 RepID=A0ABY6UPI6_BIOOC|nr:unnamed protein product [Clonostachys rosea]